MTAKTTHAACRSKPSSYAVSTEDRTSIQTPGAFMAKRMAQDHRSEVESSLADPPSAGNRAADPLGGWSVGMTKGCKLSIVRRDEPAKRARDRSPTKSGCHHLDHSRVEVITWRHHRRRDVFG